MNRNTNFAANFASTGKCSKCGKVDQKGRIRRHEQTCGEGWSLFLSRVTMHENGCWTYPAESVMRQGTVTHAKNYAWVNVNGPVPLGRVLQITCGNRRCVNPDHMQLAKRGFWL